MATATIQNKITVDGVEYATAATITADGIVRKEKTGATALPAAKTGQLTTRTDNDTGTLTMAAGHGITTGARLDIYWTGGSRRGVTVGTVSGNTVPFDLGAGDNLPANLTNVTACVPAEEEFLTTGDNAQFVTAKASLRGMVVFTTSGDAEVFAAVNDLSGPTGGAFQWYVGNGASNPLAGAAVAKAYFSNGDATGLNSLVALVGTN